MDHQLNLFDDPSQEEDIIGPEINTRSPIITYIASHIFHFVYFSIIIGLILIVSATYLSAHLNPTILSIIYIFAIIFLIPVFYLFFCFFHCIFKSISLNKVTIQAEEEDALISSN